jgi:light-regulated signal transduction histidine kinase (bacteriophytochrome)
MIDDLIQQLQKELKNSAIEPEQRERMTNLLRQVGRQYKRIDFNNQRNQRDRTITTNVLNATVVELQHQKEQLDAANISLQQKQLLLEEQSEKLKKNLQALEMSYSELEQFAYIASHDLKSPLRNISSYAQLLHRRYHEQLDKQANEFLNFIVTGTKQMNIIITDLLEYSRIDHEKESIKVDFNQMVNMVKNGLKEQIAECQGNISIVNSLPTLQVFRSSLVQLFQNLLENALKFRSNKPPMIKISAQYINRNTWKFSVSDNGLGLDEQYQEKAFMPFQRIHLERPGTGMGLAICRKAVKMHGGEIWYSTNKDSEGGTTFHFTISQSE